METTTDATNHTNGTTTSRYDLDALAGLDVAALGALYAKGRVRDVGPLEGCPKGRMLAIRGLDGAVFGDALRKLAGARWFPWGGKSFSGRGETGTGVNRVHLGGRHELFPFLTHVGRSVLDGAPAIVLDYDLPDNPGFIRAIHDEVREIESGLYLGPAMWKAESGPKFVLWFALDTNRKAVPIGTKRSFL